VHLNGQRVRSERSDAGTGEVVFSPPARLWRPGGNALRFDHAAPGDDLRVVRVELDVRYR
jgi:hypothetical protein